MSVNETSNAKESNSGPLICSVKNHMRPSSDVMKLLIKVKKSPLVTKM